MVSDPESTRQRIFEAAIEEFAAHGNAGARVDRIAEKARANKESIYRYFGTKDELLHRVLDRFLDERGEQLLPQSQDMDAYAAGLFRYFAAHPEFLRLSLWEGLELGAGPDASAMDHRRRHYQEKLSSIAEQQEAGTIDPGHLRYRARRGHDSPARGVRRRVRAPDSGSAFVTPP